MTTYHLSHLRNLEPPFGAELLGINFAVSSPYKSKSLILNFFLQVLYKVLQQNFIMPRRLLMTGTPIQNNLTELWALMHFCMPAVFGTLEQFTSTFYEDRSSSTGYLSV